MVKFFVFALLKTTLNPIISLKFLDYKIIRSSFLSLLIASHSECEPQIGNIGLIRNLLKMENLGPHPASPT